MNNFQVVKIDELRTLAFGAIPAGSYTALGVKFAHPVRLIVFTNTMNVGVTFSIDGVTDHLFVPAGGFKLFDLTTNKIDIARTWVLPVNTQIYVKPVSAAASGSVYVECLWGE